MKYVKPKIVKQDAKTFTENEFVWFVIPAAAIVVAAMGGAPGWCKFVCGEGNVRSCEAGWIYIKAVCK